MSGERTWSYAEASAYLKSNIHNGLSWGKHIVYYMPAFEELRYLPRYSTYWITVPSWATMRGDPIYGETAYTREDVPRCGDQDWAYTAKRETMSKSQIEWTDEVWNPVTGCTKISPGCKNCYAETMAKRLQAMGQPRYLDGFNLTLQPDVLSKPLSWRKPRRVFVNSMSDLFHKDVPLSYIAAVFGVMAACPQHTFQLLTKRPARMREFFDWLQGNPTAGYQVTECHLQAARHGVELRAKTIAQAPVEWPLPNVWLGVSVESQDYAEQRMELLLDTPAAVHFVSCEPLLSAVRLDCIRLDSDKVLNSLSGSTFIADSGVRRANGLDWVICGGESGAGYCRLDLSWAESLRKQCASGGIPFFFKQDSGLKPGKQGRASDALWACKEYPDIGSA